MYMLMNVTICKCEVHLHYTQDCIPPSSLSPPLPPSLSLSLSHCILYGFCMCCFFTNLPAHAVKSAPYTCLEYIQCLRQKLPMTYMYSNIVIMSKYQVTLSLGDPVANVICWGLTFHWCIIPCTYI